MQGYQNIKWGDSLMGPSKITTLVFLTFAKNRSFGKSYNSLKFNEFAISETPHQNEYQISYITIQKNAKNLVKRAIKLVRYSSIQLLVQTLAEYLECCATVGCLEQLT